jgi:putative colanic acid biosynthesis glycosyltransferase WcaI
MARILLHSLVFVPDGVSTAYLMKDLAVGLQRRGHEVTVLTSTPHYNLEARAIREYPMTPAGRGVMRGEVDGVVVWHLPMRLKGQRVAARVTDYLKFHCRSLVFAARRLGGFDVVLAPSPPLTIGLVSGLIGMLKGAPSIYNVQELYPDFAINSGLVRNGPIIGAFRLLERAVYATNSLMIPISTPFARALSQRGVPAAKLRIIPNFVDTGFYRPLPRRNEFSIKHGLEDSFVVLYAGNIGLSQDWEGFLTAAKQLQKHPITFAVTGDGVLGEWLKQEVFSRGLSNVRIFGYLEREETPQLYASCDLGTIPMKARTTIDTFPSKIYTLFACGKSVVAHADPGSELEKTIAESGCGSAVLPSDSVGYAAAILNAYERRSELPDEGARGRDYVERGFSKEAIAAQYEDAIVGLLSKRGKAVPAVSN